MTLTPESSPNLIQPNFALAYDSAGNVGTITHAALNLYYNRARFYDPATGRFMSKDPIGFVAGDMNLYRYVGNGPTNGTDPSGESWLDDYANWFPDLGIGRHIIYPILKSAIGDEALAGASDTQIVVGTGVGVAAVGVGIYTGSGGLILEEAAGILFEYQTGLPLVVNPIDIAQQGMKQGAK